MEAYVEGSKRQNQYLHQTEAPVALLSSLFANSNRDPKKQRKPYSMEDFFLYKPRDDRNIPMASYGAAVMKMIELGTFPRWAYCFYKDFKAAASGPAPARLALMHEYAVLVAPEIGDETVRGLLISEDKASDQVLEFESDDGVKLSLQMPKLDIRYSANEDVELQIIKP